jgi:uncharacterized membrane protein YuzA (DUF378 family)
MMADTKKQVDAIAWWLVIVGALVHLITGVGQVALLSFINPIFGLVQIVVGLSGVWLIARKLKWIK